MLVDASSLLCQCAGVRVFSVFDFTAYTIASSALFVTSENSGLLFSTIDVCM